MIASSDAGGGSADRLSERVARAGLLQVGEPGDVRLWHLVERLGAIEALSALRAGPEPVRGLGHYGPRLAGLVPERSLEQGVECGARLVVPGDLEWPTQLGDLDLPGGGGDRAASPPLALWVRGPGQLRLAAVRSVAVVGARAATGYGTHVAAELASGLAVGSASAVGSAPGRPFAVFSGGAYGIDAAAHRGALAVGGTTVAVLACGVDVPYPRGHSALFDRIVAQGLLVSELPPGSSPTRSRFLERNRLIAALTRATVVVEAATRSGALNTVGWADRLGRTVLGLPGPVTSTMSAGVHRQIRAGVATLVTSAEEVVEAVTSLGEQLATAERQLVAEQVERAAGQRPTDQLDPLALRVFDALPRSGSRALLEVARSAGLSSELVGQRLIQLRALGLVELSGGRYRLGPRAGRPDPSG